MNTADMTAKAILEESQRIVIGKRTFEVSPPSIATLVLVSREIEKLPKGALNKEEAVSESLRVAKECAVMGRILAIFVLGAKKIKQAEQGRGKLFLQRIFSGRATEELEEMERVILEELTPKEVSMLLGKVLAMMDIAFFFESFIFLQEASLIKETKKTTASGL